jgi:hypothetical protein
MTVAVAVGLTGCGKPDYTYVTNADSGTYLRIPTDWHAQPMPGPAQFGIDARDISPGANRDLAEREWLVGIDAGPTFDDSALVVPDATRPKGFVQVRTLLPEEAADVSTNDLRNLFVDVEAAVAEQREAVRGNPYGARLAPGFELLVDDVDRLPDGVHGVHLVYQFATVQGLVTVDQTSLLDQDQTVLYQLVLACTAQCYDDWAADVERVRSSFTVVPTSEGR